MDTKKEIKTPFDLRVLIQDLLEKEGTMTFEGGGSLVVPPYTADLELTCGKCRFVIIIDEITE